MRLRGPIFLFLGWIQLSVRGFRAGEGPDGWGEIKKDLECQKNVQEQAKVARPLEKRNKNQPFTSLATGGGLASVGKPDSP